MTTALLTISALYGLIMGSFLNVVAVRDGDRHSILVGRSQCPHCKHVLHWYELIPLLSFVFQRARCRKCKKAISWRYPLVELVTAALTAFLIWFGVVQNGSWILGVGLVLTFYIFQVVSMIDIDSMEIPLEYAVGAGVLGAIVNIWSQHLTVRDTLLGVVVGAGVIAFVLYGWKLAFKQDGMGVGDIWLAGALGAAVGYPLILITIGLASIVGAIFGSIALLSKRASLNSAIPFGPYLCIGALLALLWGQHILQWYILYP